MPSAAIAEFEHSLIFEQTAKAAACDGNDVKFDPKPSYRPRAEAIARRAAGETLAAIGALRDDQAR